MRTLDRLRERVRQRHGAAGALALAALLAAVPANALRTGDVVDHLRFRNQQGAEIRIGDLRGRVVVLYAFTSTHASSRDMLARLSRLDARADCNVVVLALSLDRDPDDLAFLLQGVRPRVALLLDSSGELATSLAVGSVPTAFVLDRQGEIQERRALQTGDDLRALEASVGRLLAD